MVEVVLEEGLDGISECLRFHRHPGQRRYKHRPTGRSPPGMSRKQSGLDEAWV